MSKEVLFFSRFALNENSGGGCRREAQLAEVLHPLDYKFISWRDSKPWFKNRMSKRQHLLFQLEKRFHTYRKYWDDFYIDHMFKMKGVTRDWKKNLESNNHIKLAIVDDPLYFYPLVEYLYKRNIPMVGLSQNIESLSYSQLQGPRQLELFNKEIKLFKKCRLVVTISREETFLLKNFNIPTYYLPYYPVQSIKRRMLNIREKRNKSEKKGFLVIGTAWNKVTLEGMKGLIDFWTGSLNKFRQEKLLVAGFGTSRLLKKVKSENIEYLGEISNQKLDEIFTGIKAMICYQEYGSGALTKIAEMLIAGVPVLANTHAARSYHEFREVIEFSGFADLERAVLELESLKKPLTRHSETIIKSSHKELVDKIRALNI